MTAKYIKCKLLKSTVSMYPSGSRLSRSCNKHRTKSTWYIQELKKERCNVKPMTKESKSAFLKMRTYKICALEYIRGHSQGRT